MRTFSTTLGAETCMISSIVSATGVSMDISTNFVQKATANLLPESVEWMNTFLSVVWGLVKLTIWPRSCSLLHSIARPLRMTSCIHSHTPLVMHISTNFVQKATANLLPESVEWMNTFLSVVWGLVNPEEFGVGCYPGRFLRCEHSLQPWVQRPA
jgi:hypothetical protein